MTDTPGQQRCTLCDCERIPLDREKTRFGACTNIQCEDPTLDYRNEQSALPELLENARHHVMTDEEKEAQRQSWVRGEMALDRDGQTRVMREVGGAQPEPDQWVRDPASLDIQDLIANELRSISRYAGSDEERDTWVAAADHVKEMKIVARAGSSPAPSPERSDKDYAIEHGGYLANAAEFFQNSINEYARVRVTADPDRDEELIDAARETQNDAWSGLSSAIYEFRKRAKRVTGNEGKDEVESRGKDIAVGGSDSSGDRTGSDGASLPAPLASPAVVTRVCVYGYQWCDGTNRHICEWCIKDLQAKVSELEAQLSAGTRSAEAKRKANFGLKW